MKNKKNAVGFFKTEELAKKQLNYWNNKPKLKGDKSTYFIEQRKDIFVLFCLINHSDELKKEINDWWENRCIKAETA